MQSLLRIAEEVLMQKTTVGISHRLDIDNVNESRIHYSAVFQSR